MTNSVNSCSRFGEQTATDTMHASARGLIIEDLDGSSETGAAMLSICVVAAPAATAVAAASIRFE
ncbi:hypothetical protein OOK13_09680 [Streptomyces sp. NBC_00378]|uniref:Uncharacterized protein n=1 Tax=Streptomyces sanglieri TaxID=193460 RepID=A0ABW2WSP8_9ACTN|nr:MULTISPECIES: hypothetical protein [unclassified Streptomyces]WSG53974.1 hypothetical protein OHA38_31600 [Streptomyces sp. NBC_01732]WSW04772.1 hypothetical protein OG298_10585 [Streptomyces sp. NBC_01005]WSX04605.1 hypothetical protein OG355_31575 [Streptomyces sp. NBC_00987]WTB57362.1 hypothetical protein OG832_31485 [Streptomyces sp. NBC_00826]WTC94276.1 hypothetical protein OH736_10585 [Streptomyces sp. NBC_01650]WTH89756.1 hypothetical protein OIC43_12205 [Streptomyces sp. NBC_00825]